LPEPILVGRERELEELQRFLDGILEGEGTAVFISGEAGSGKTRLAEEFLKQVKAKDIIVLAGTCMSNVAIPYFPFIEAFSSFESDDEKEIRAFDTRQLSLRIASTETGAVEGVDKAKVWARAPPQIWRDQAFATITEELLRLSTGKPTVLFIDDLHWADSASLALLHYVARAAKMERILVLGSFRIEEIKASVDGQPHPLTEVLRLMGREDLFQEIKLSNLNQNDVSRIAEDMLGGALDTESAERLSEESDGNPLFVVESLRMMHSQGKIKKEQGQWRLEDAAIGVPDKVKDVILRRFDSLKTNERRILDAASVIGERFASKLVADVLSQNNLGVLEALRAIAQNTLLALPEGNDYRFKHAKIREMLCSEIPQSLRAEYHARIAEALEANSPPAALPLNDLAYHYAKAENKEKAVRYSLLAGQDALARCANTEAIKHFEFALNAVSTVPGKENERRTALEGLGDAYYANCMFEQAIRAYKEFARIETSHAKLRALRKEMEAVWYKDMDSQRLIELIKQAEPYIVLDRLESARVQWNKGRALLWLGDVKSSLNAHEEALKIFEEEGSLIDAAFALWGTGIIRAVLGIDEEKGLGEILRGIAIHQELGDAHGELLAWKNGGVDIFHLCGLFDETCDNAANVLRLGEKLGDFDNIAGTLISMSDISEYKGNLTEALAQALKAQEFAQKTDAEGTKCKVNAKLATLYALLNDTRKAEFYCDEMKKTPPAIRFHPRNILYVTFAPAVLFAVKKQWTEADNAIKQAQEAISRMYPRNMGAQFWLRFNQALILGLRGRTEEGKTLDAEAERILERIEKRFDKTNIQAKLTAPREISVDQGFEMRFDVVNVGKKSGSLLKIEEIVAPQFKIESLPSQTKNEKGNLEIQEGHINPFQVKALKLKLSASRAGLLTIEPKIIFSDASGETRACKVEAVNINVKHALPTKSETAPAISEPNSEAAQKAIDFLITAFKEDYVQRKLLHEKAGWRTLMDLVKQGQLTPYSVYGSVNHRGTAVSELEHSGLVETRVFTGERGRGGKILKLRIAYEKEGVKQYIDQHSSEMKKK